MKFLLLLIPLVMAAAPAKKAKPAPKPVAPSTAAKVEKFSELRLQGNLKRPELSYDFEDEMKPEELTLELPANFDNALYSDLEK